MKTDNIPEKVQHLAKDMIEMMKITNESAIDAIYLSFANACIGGRLMTEAETRLLIADMVEAVEQITLRKGKL